MTRRTLLAVLVCAIGLTPLRAVSAPAAPFAPTAPTGPEQQLLQLVNREREQAGLGKLTWSDQLAKAALDHSKLLAEHRSLSHQFTGEPPLEQRVGATGVRFDSIAENVAEAPDVASAHKGLMESPGHRANILDRKSNAIGISIVQRAGPAGPQLYVTQDFAHVTTVYTEQQFRDAVVASVNQARKEQGLGPITVTPNADLRTSACAHGADAPKLMATLRGATGLVMFSAMEPSQFPSDLRQSAGDKAVKRMSLGVCLQTDSSGFSKFWVVAAFFR